MYWQQNTVPFWHQHQYFNRAGTINQLIDGQNLICNYFDFG